MDAERQALVRLLGRTKPVHYAGECDHCGIDEADPATCPTLKLIAEVEDALEAAQVPPSCIHDYDENGVCLYCDRAQVPPSWADMLCDGCGKPLGEKPPITHHSACWQRELAEAESDAQVPPPVARPDVPPAEEVANIECHIRTLLPESYLESIGANVQAPSHKRELHHRVMRILADLANRLEGAAARGCRGAAPRSAPRGPARSGSSSGSST